MFDATTHFIFSSDENGLDNLIIEASYVMPYWKAGLLSGKYLLGVYRHGELLKGLDLLDYLVDTVPRGASYAPVFQDCIYEYTEGLFILVLRTEAVSYCVERDFILDTLEYSMNGQYLDRDTAAMLFPFTFVMR